jgi:hypothetical protein
MKKIIPLLVSAFALWVRTGMAGDTLTEVQSSLPVLIATEHSVYKDAVVAKVVQQLKERSIPCSVVTLKEIKNCRVNQYRIVVALNSIWGGRLKSEVRKFLSPLTPEQRKRVVLISTVGNEDWQAKEKDVSAISCASKTSRVDSAATLIVTRAIAIDGQ